MKKRLLEQALQIARSEHGTHPEWEHYMHWTFVCQSGHLVEWGTNVNAPPSAIMGYHERAKTHSELRAFRRAKGLLDRRESWNIINIRLTRKGDLKLSAPCTTCFDWLQAVGCQKAYFTTPNGWAQMRIQ